MNFMLQTQEGMLGAPLFWSEACRLRLWRFARFMGDDSRKWATSFYGGTYVLWRLPNGVISLSFSGKSPLLFIILWQSTLTTIRTSLRLCNGLGTFATFSIAHWFVKY